MHSPLALALFSVLWLWSSALAEDLVPPVPGAALMDFTTGRLLFQKNPDWQDPPASLTKLMTLHLAWKALEAGTVQPSTKVPVTPAVLALVPAGSSLMFLEAGQQVTVKELMLGLAVDSGNDAGLVLAQFLGGSQSGFVGLMNAETKALGLARTEFRDAFGFSPENRTTAADWARFCRLYIQAHPQALELLHSVRQLAYPLEENRASGDRRPVKTIVQANRNSLLESYPGADGLKTGYITESGYNLAATARRGSQRLIAVVLGVQAADLNEGSRVRAAQASKLLDFGFANYPLRPLPLPVLPPVRVWYAQESLVDVSVAQEAVYPLSTEESPLVQARVVLDEAYLGPFPPHTPLGRVEWSRGGKVFYSLPLVSQKLLHEAPWWQGVADAVSLFFQGLFGQKAPVRPSASS
ncbi:MAG: D-alanyl-D-alanine carboxypeptidase family protein [Spirochaetales bacterium]